MTTREAEIARYVECYKVTSYRMGRKRYDAARKVIREFPFLSNLLDVGAGRGELAEIADEFGIDYQGIEPVPYLASDRVKTGIATDLSFADKAFDSVVCLDVLEHLIESDIESALREFSRVARSRIFLTASERASRCSIDGRDLHISKRPLAEWQRLFEDVFAGAQIKPLGMVGVSPGWLITLQ